MRCESTRLCGVKMVYNDLENMLNEDNWDNGFEIPKEILDRKSTRLNSSHSRKSRMPSSA